MANIIQINGYAISSSNSGGGSSFPYTGSAIISGSLVVTGSITSTLGFTGSLFGTASFSTNALTASRATTASFTLTASRVQLPNGDSISEQNSQFTISAARPTISGSNIVSIWGNNGISLDSQTTVKGNLLPASPYTNNTSSFSLGSPTAAWKDLYVSNGSVYFISGSNTASISFTNGNINFGGTNVTIPSGSIVPTASLALTASFTTNATNASQVFVIDGLSGNDYYIPIFVQGTEGSNTSLYANGPGYDTNTSTLIATNFNGTATAALTALTASSLSNTFAPSFITYSGGSQANSTTTLADVHSSAGFDNISVGFYEFEIFIIYNAAATSTGARFSLSGSVSQNYLACDIGYSTSVSDRGAFQFRSFDGGTAAQSSAATTSNTAILQGHINTTSTGQLRLRFSTRVATSAITVTDITGFIRKLY